MDLDMPPEMAAEADASLDNVLVAGYLQQPDKPEEPTSLWSSLAKVLHLEGQSMPQADEPPPQPPPVVVADSGEDEELKAKEKLAALRETLLRKAGSGTEENGRLAQKVRILLEEQAEQASQIESLKKQVEEVMLVNNTLSHEARDARAEASALEGEVKELRGRLGPPPAEGGAARRPLLTQPQGISPRTPRGVVEEELQGRLERLGERFQLLATERDRLNNRVVALESEVPAQVAGNAVSGESPDEVELLRRHIEELSQRVTAAAEAEQRAFQLEAQAAARNEGEISLQNECRSLEAKNGALAAENSALRATCDQLRAEVQGLQAQMEAVSGDLARVCSEHEAAVAAQADAAAQAAHAGRASQRLREDHSAVLAKMSELTTERDAREEQYQELARRVRVTEKQRDFASTVADELKEELAVARAREQEQAASADAAHGQPASPGSAAEAHVGQEVQSLRVQLELVERERDMARQQTEASMNERDEVRRQLRRGEEELHNARQVRFDTASGEGGESKEGEKLQAEVARLRAQCSLLEGALRGQPQPAPAPAPQPPLLPGHQHLVPGQQPAAPVQTALLPGGVNFVVHNNHASACAARPVVWSKEDPAHGCGCGRAVASPVQLIHTGPPPAGLVAPRPPTQTKTVRHLGVTMTTRRVRNSNPPGSAGSSLDFGPSTGVTRPAGLSTTTAAAATTLSPPMLAADPLITSVPSMQASLPPTEPMTNPVRVTQMLGVRPFQH